MQNDSFTQWLKTLNFDYWSTGQHKILAPAFVEKWLRGEAVLLDVRADVETRYAVFPTALHIPIDALPEHLDEIPRDKLVATFCSGGDRANVAFAYLHAQGFDNVRILKGGYTDLLAALHPGKIRHILKTS